MTYMYRTVRSGPEHQPGNESPEHYVLKQLALAWLLTHCKLAATEVDGFWPPIRQLTAEIRKAGKEKGHPLHWRGFKNGPGRGRIDAIGVRGKWVGNWQRSYGVEVKVSRSDFQTGFCYGPEYVYVLTPPGLLSLDEVPPDIGLMEADPEAVEVELAHNNWWNIREVRRYSILRAPRKQERHMEATTVGLLVARQLMYRARGGAPLMPDLRLISYERQGEAS